MVYLIYGTEEYLIKQEVNNLKKQVNINDISYYDLDNVSLKNIIDDANSISLFSDKRMLIVENSSIFTGSSKKRNDINYLESYLEHPNNNTILIFTVNYDKLDSRKKIVNLIKENGQIKEFNDNYDIKSIVKKMFDNYQINDKNIDILIDRVGRNLLLLEQEISKIKTYKGDNYNIEYEDIINLTNKSIDTDIFHLIDNIINKNKEKALESYYEMIKLGEEPIKIIVMLANQFRLMYQVKRLNKNRNNIYDIMKILGQKKYPIEKALEKSYKYDEKSLLNILYKLANLDIQIKSGKINKDIALELFILEN